MSIKSKKQNRLVVRQASPKDIPGIQSLIRKIYQNSPGYPEEMMRGQIYSFPEGHFVAEFEEKIVGYSACIRMDEKTALAPHTWKEITGGGYGSTHNGKGEYLYGYEIAVDPDFRNLKIGSRFYNERKKLCRLLHLKGIVFGGRMPRLKKKLKQVGSVENYIEQVQSRKIKDPVLYFQIRNGFRPLGVLKDYLPMDEDSLGYACHLLWENPGYKAEQLSRTASGTIDKVRISVVQYKQRKISSFEEFQQITNYFIDVVSDYKSDFVLFPELFTMQLLSIENEELPADESIAKLCDYTDRLQEYFRKMAIKYNVNIIAGSHPTRGENNEIFNTAMVFLRNGEIHSQHKIHATPNEKFWWNIQGGDGVSVIDTDCGPIGVLICYDSEFPELARHLADQGANIIFVPFLTDEKQSYNRVRYCCQARAIENQCFVAMSGSVGNLPSVQNMDIHYAQSAILSPCDFNFGRDGIMAEATPNVEIVSVADVRIQDLIEARSSGTVRNLRDRRHDLYEIVWKKN